MWGKSTQQPPNWSVSSTQSVSLTQHHWPPWPAVSSHSILAWSYGASQSGPCLSPVSSPQSFLSPPHRLPSKAEHFSIFRPVHLLVLLPGMYFPSPEPPPSHSPPPSSSSSRVILKGQIKSRTAVRRHRVQSWVCHLTSCVALGNLLPLSKPVSSSVKRDNNSYLKRLF